MIFNRIVVVDWSASRKATSKASDAIWLADAALGRETWFSNPTTRFAAMSALGEIIEGIGDNERLFVGFDFAFGYPSDAKSLPGEGRWKAVWSHLSEEIFDGEDNDNNRFDVGALLNTRFPPPGPFWGCPAGFVPAKGTLTPKRPAYVGRERRHIETLVPRAQSAWKLAYAGSVGSQALTGIARLQEMRERLGKDVQVWPFETAFADNVHAKVILAEIYPSLWPVTPLGDEVKDRAQVRTLADGFLGFQKRCAFSQLLDGPRRQAPGVREDALSHEGWMVGFADEALPL